MGSAPPSRASEGMRPQIEVASTVVSTAFSAREASPPPPGTGAGIREPASSSSAGCAHRPRRLLRI